MKKRLEADLMSIAHKILQIKDKSDVSVLFFETRRLYEKLAVLRFVEEYFGDAKPTIGQAEVVKKMKHFFEEYDVFEFPPTKVIPELVSDKILIEQEEAADLENSFEEIEDSSAIEFEPSFEIEEEQEEEVEDIETNIEEAEKLNAIEFEPSFEIEEEQEEEVEDIETNIEEAEKLNTIEFEPSFDIEEEQEEEVEDFENNIQETENASDIEFETSFDIEEEQEEEVEDFENNIQETENASDIEFETSFDIEIEEDEISKNVEDSQISFLDLLGSDYSETKFEKLNQTAAIPPEIIFDIDEESDIDEEEIAEGSDFKITSLNEKLAKGIQIDLNDKIAFVKNLFGNSDEDYNRVLNQLITYDSFEEAQCFIEEMVKPDYNSWEGKEDYEKRFIEIIEKKFA